VAGLKRKHVGFLTIDHGSPIETRHSSVRQILPDKEKVDTGLKRIMGNGNIAKKIAFKQ
jgi:hypothetical protein